jgi:hypothetical protein
MVLNLLLNEIQTMRMVAKRTESEKACKIAAQERFLQVCLKEI